ncbi:MAG: S49 family peptidase [Rhizobiaceae bacterium]|nr:S49 family peptidase [Rhizobiaceae bacterium]
MKLRKLLPGKLGQVDPVIPVVRLQGAIGAAGGPLSKSLSLAGVAGLLSKAFKDKEAPAVAIAINSPGGSPVQSRLIYTRIRELAEQHEKQVLVFVEDVAASGGYMLAIAGDEIFVDPTSIVGSIGVVSASFGFDKAIEKLGIDRRVYTAGKNKVSLDPFQPEKKQDIAYLKELQLEIHQVFIDMVKERREGKLADDPDLFTGKFWTGIRAKDLGLVDEFGHMGTILKERFGEKVKLKLIQQKRGLFGRGGMGAGLSLGETSVSSAVDTAIMTAEEKALRARYGL